MAIKPTAAVTHPELASITAELFTISPAATIVASQGVIIPTAQMQKYRMANVRSRVFLGVNLIVKPVRTKGESARNKGWENIENHLEEKKYVTRIAFNTQWFSW
ncbi:hypothetical protein GU926_13775 [Nibribacter ruber]|uniref:Uncharacterized protein n=1 Tax=Nibribacter ruber TaxID=2698458 RepID=A0A6P1P226_9BACT|nr:hypothetical protein [Nibribacter ruber]QHL88443.1 hypothetical protein GU926_13775 [Nibribacter ruber]